MQFIRRAIPAAAAITGVAMLAAGCGGSSPKTTGSSASSNSSGNFVTQAYRYAACMRDHGASNFPDPHVSESNGSTQISMMAVGGKSPQFRAANNACRSILPAPSGGDTAAQRQKREQAEFAFAHCLREHGINGFPDPGANGQLSLAMIRAAGIDLTSPQVRAAALACVPVTNGAITRAEVLQATSGNPPQDGSTAQGTGTNP